MPHQEEFYAVLKKPGDLEREDLYSTLNAALVEYNSYLNYVKSSYKIWKITFEEIPQ